MRYVTIKKCSQVCSKELGGCGRTIKQGERAWKQVRIQKRYIGTRYLCKECGKKVFH